MQTLLRGEMVRATLLNPWGWLTAGTYAYYADFLLVVAALGVAGALLFELSIALRCRGAARQTATLDVLEPQP